MRGRASRNHRAVSPGAPRGVTLVELLLVVVMLSVLASYVLASYRPALHDQLLGAAQVIAADVAYARSLAVSHNSNYRLQFNIAKNQYWLEHSGSNSLLDTLPESPYGDADDEPDRQTTDLAQLPALNGSVSLIAVQRATDAPLRSTTELEFGPLGSLTSPERGVIWLACGGGDARLYVSVEVDPVTSLADIGDVQVQPPVLVP